MKIKNIYELKKVVNQYLVIRVEDALVLDNMITINEIGKDIFDFLKEEHSEDEVVSYILSNYEVTEEKARTKSSFKESKTSLKLNIQLFLFE